MTPQENYKLRLSIELEGLKLCKHSTSIPRSKQEENIQRIQNQRADLKLQLEKILKV